MDFVFLLLISLVSLGKVVGLPGRISIEAARSLDITIPQHVAEERADWLDRVAVITRIMLDQGENQNKRQEKEEKSADVKTVAPVEDFSQIPFKCPYFPPSQSVPTSVHALRPGDIKVVAALGDSITAGNGIRANTWYGTWGVANRGESFSVGGERSLDEQSVTLLNIIRKFNPLVEGGSYCARGLNHPYAGYNVAVPGATNRGLEAQALDLVTKLAQDLDRFYNSWKVVTLLIGGNDMCRHCAPVIGRNFTAEEHRYGVELALDVLHHHLPRTFVNLQIMTEVGFVKNLYDNDTEELCHALHEVACPCALSNSTEDMKKLQEDYYTELNDLVDSGRYDDREDFVVVVQPFLKEQEPFKNEDGTFDMSFFAPDCFHPGVKMHQSFAYMLWNSMLTSVRDKVYKWDESLGLAYKCPTESNPYFFTKKNGPVKSNNFRKSNVDIF